MEYQGKGRATVKSNMNQHNEAVKRIMREYKVMQKNPMAVLDAHPLEVCACSRFRVSDRDIFGRKHYLSGILLFADPTRVLFKVPCRILSSLRYVSEWFCSQAAAITDEYSCQLTTPLHPPILSF